MSFLSRYSKEPILSKSSSSTVLNFQKSLDDKTGPCDFYDYDFRTNKFWFALFKPLFKFMYHMGWNLNVKGKENVPKNRNVIFLPNHQSHLDGFIVAAYFNSAPLIIGDEKLLRNRAFAIISKMFNVFPVRKSTKSTAIVEYAISRVNRGDSIMWFPEGQRNKNPMKNKMMPGKLGTGMLVHATDAVIIPVFIRGAEFAMPLGKKLTMGLGPRSIRLDVEFGKEINLSDLRQLPPSKDVSKKVVDRVIEKIEELRPKGPYIVQKTKTYHTKHNYKKFLKNIYKDYL